jgi:type IV pilus assembly protein PilB
MAKNGVSKYSSLIKRLVEASLITSAESEVILKRSEESEESLTKYLVESKIVDGDLLAEHISQVFGTPLISLDHHQPDDSLKSIIDKGYIREHRTLPLFKHKNKLFLGVSDPTYIRILDDIKFKTGMSAELVVVEHQRLQYGIDVWLGEAGTKINDYMQGFEEVDVNEAQDEPDDSIDSDDQSDEPIIQFVNKMLVDAVKSGASDIHLEHYEGIFRVRFRIDGMLEEKYRPPVNVSTRIISRMKVLANLDISEKRVPQDGRIKVSLQGKKIDFRINTLPTAFGEKLVLRIMDDSATKIGIDKLGFNEQQKRLYMRALSKPQGMILVTGPTGSGKTVTLYSGLNIINTESKNISTAEDPVEMNVIGINQVSINPKVGLHFSDAMRAFLRQDPDVIMVGEIRDLETAEISIKASQTGHLVLSTLHTNSAIESISRIKQMGIPVYNLATSLSLVIAQRLARRLCEHCKQIHEPEADVVEDLKLDPARLKQNTIYMANPDGCKHCNRGYKGRVGVYEMLDINDVLSAAILDNASAPELMKIAKEQGFKTLRDDGIEKVYEGLTSVEEVYRVLL